MLGTDDPSSMRPSRTMALTFLTLLYTCWFSFYPNRRTDIRDGVYWRWCRSACIYRCLKREKRYRREACSRLGDWALETNKWRLRKAGPICRIRVARKISRRRRVSLEYSSVLPASLSPYARFEHLRTRESRTTATGSIHGERRRYSQMWVNSLVGNRPSFIFSPP